MGETYTPMSVSKPSITVNFYGSNIFTTPPLTIIQEGLPLSCEQVCIRCAEHLSASLGKLFPLEDWDKIGPKFFPMFGLYAADHDLQQWIPDAHIFDSFTSNLKFYFRVRVRPARESIPEGMFADYLCCQCTEDFLTGRVWSHFGVEIKIGDVKDISKRALWILMAGASYKLQGTVACRPERILHTPLKEITTLEHIRNKVNVQRLLPEKMPPELEKQYNIMSASTFNIRNPFMRIESKSVLRTYTKDFFKKWGEETLSVMRHSFVEDFLANVPYYLLEYFPAEKVENYPTQKGKNGEELNLGPLPSVSVELVIRPHQDGCVPGLYFNKKFKAHLRDIFGADISECERVQAKNQKCRVLLKIQHTQPMILDLPNQASAKSFLTVLETYCRLKYNYYESLNVEYLAAPSLQVLKDLHCFGPMEEETARRYLREQTDNDERLAQCEACYILYQDAQDFGLLHATGIKMDPEGPEIVTYDIHFTMDKAGSGYSCCMKVGGEEKSFPDVQQLRYFLTTTLNLGQRIFDAEGSTCGAMQLLQEDSILENIYSYAGVENERRGRQGREDLGNQPLMYREDQVNMAEASLIAKGEFCDVYQFKQINRGREAILKKVTHKTAAVQNAYREGAELLLRLHDHCHFFVRVYGFMITNPTRIIYECMPDGNGSLLQRLRDENAPPLNWLQVASVLKQLAECLCSLKEAGMVYGNFCCAKILILKEKDTALTIRLGDPSMALYHSNLSLEDAHNAQRMAWLAPERRSGRLVKEVRKPSKSTLASEVYSLGTSIWEMICRGKDPIQCIPHSIKVQDFFKNNKLPDPEFKKVMATHGDVSSVPIPVNRTQQWVESQNFTTVAVGDNLQEGEIADYNQVTVADSEQGSNFASGETGMTELSGKSGQGKSKDVDQSRRAVAGTETLRKIQEKVLKLMHDCWQDNPHQRPAPLPLMKAACEVEELAERATTGSDLWNIQLVLSIALETGNVQDKEEGEKLFKQVRQTQANQAQQEREDYEVVRDLERQVRQHITSAIDHTLLTPIGDTPLGKGNYGTVMAAYLQEPSETRAMEAAARMKREKVAVKTIKEDQSPNQTAQLLKEALNVFSLEHPHVVKLKGIVMKGKYSQT
ncbi:non-receptor tyrosine-protein kinase TYK2-like [Littorina saxatilis]|uniref:non-receptor tyrosine-protein kinase TYK2-like n=1 Tax=Littorina saxatilis TaxID=31220 RepID=UPI0038B59D06